MCSLLPVLLWDMVARVERLTSTYPVVGSSLQEKSNYCNWPLQLPGIDQGQLMADVFNSQPLIVNMMTAHGVEQFPEHQDNIVPIAASQADPGPVQSHSSLTSEHTNKQSHDKMTTGMRRNADGGPTGSVYPSTRNRAPISTRSDSAPELSDEALNRLHATTFTNPDPFAPQPQRPVHTYSPQVSPKTDPWRMHPIDEAQVLSLGAGSPPRTEDVPSLTSGRKSIATSRAANDEVVIPSSLPEGPTGPTKSSPQIPLTSTLPRRVARLFAVRPGRELR